MLYFDKSKTNDQSYVQAFFINIIHEISRYMFIKEMPHSMLHPVALPTFMIIGERFCY